MHGSLAIAVINNCEISPGVNGLLTIDRVCIHSACHIVIMHTFEKNITFLSDCDKMWPCFTNRALSRWS